MVLHLVHSQDSDVLTEAIKDFSQSYPGVLKPMISERDEYMVWMLHRLASQYVTLDTEVIEILALKNGKGL